METKAPYGYVLNKEEQTVTFVYVDDKTPVIKESMTFENDRQKVDLSVLKLDEETELAIAGAEFGLYAAEDIENADGEVIILEVHSLDEDNEEYLSIKDATTLDKVFEVFKERFKDDFNFVD